MVYRRNRSAGSGDDCGAIPFGRKTTGFRAARGQLNGGYDSTQPNPPHGLDRQCGMLRVVACHGPHYPRKDTARYRIRTLMAAPCFRGKSQHAFSGRIDWRIKDDIDLTGDLAASRRWPRLSATACGLSSRALVDQYGFDRWIIAGGRLSFSSAWRQTTERRSPAATEGDRSRPDSHQGHSRSGCWAKGRSPPRRPTAQ